MAIKRGTNTIRRNAKNFTHEIAQKRLEEALIPFKQQVTNSLAVDAVVIDYYSIQRKTGRPCSCSMSPQMILEDDRNEIQVTIPNKHKEEHSASIKFQDENIFGEGLAEHVFNDDKVMTDTILDVTGNTSVTLIEEDQESFTGMSGSVDCGICYRTNNVPPFKVANKFRVLFTHADIQDMEGFYVDRTTAPYTISTQSDHTKGWVEFELNIPKYFKVALVSVRNNLHHLSYATIHDGDLHYLREEDLRRHAGQSMPIRITEPQFTHVVIEFEMDVQPLLANISAESQSLDYNRLMTIGDIQVVLPPSLASVENGDILIVRDRNLALLVRDKEWKATSDRKTFGWRASTRVLQPGEAYRTLALSQKLRRV